MELHTVPPERILGIVFQQLALHSNVEQINFFFFKGITSLVTTSFRYNMVFLQAPVHSLNCNSTLHNNPGMRTFQCCVSVFGMPAFLFMFFSTRLHLPVWPCVTCLFYFYFFYSLEPLKLRSEKHLHGSQAGGRHVVQVNTASSKTQF